MARRPDSILEYADRDRLLQLARNNYDPESLAEKLIPGKLLMTEPPQPFCIIRDKATGEQRSSCTPGIAASKYALRDDVIIEHRKPHPYHVSLWRWNEALRAEIETLYMEFAAQNLIHYREPDELPDIDRALADVMCSTRWRRVSRDEALSYAPGFGGDRGRELLTPHGRVYLDIGVESRCVYLSQIALETKGTGLGTRIMTAIRDFAAARHCDVCVYKVTNRQFYRRFGWLTPKDGGGEFRAKWSDLTAKPDATSTTDKASFDLIAGGGAMVLRRLPADTRARVVLESERHAKGLPPTDASARRVLAAVKEFRNPDSRATASNPEQPSFRAPIP